MRRFALILVTAAAGCVRPPPLLGTESEVPRAGAREAAAAFDGLSNGAVDQATFVADLEVFDEFEVADDGLGPVYNAQSCRECHQNPLSGGGSHAPGARRSSCRMGTWSSSRGRSSAPASGRRWKAAC